MTKPSFSLYTGLNQLNAMLTGPDFSLVGQAARWLTDRWNVAVPEGYEDETGFHFEQEKSVVTRRLPADAPFWLGEFI